MGQDPCNGNVYIFINRDRIKLLHWEPGGMVQYSNQVVKADISKWPRMRGVENDYMVITVIPLGLMNMDEVAEVNPCRS